MAVRPATSTASTAPIPPGVGAIEPTAGARFLVLPGLKSDQKLEIYFRDVDERWRSARFVHWPPSPRSGEQPVADLERMIHLWGEPVTQIAIQFTRPGEIALEGPPRLMR